MVEQCIAPEEIQEGDLVAYIEGVASANVVAHVARCPACAAEVKALCITDSLLSSALGQTKASMSDELLSSQAGPPYPGKWRQTGSKGGRNSRTDGGWLTWPGLGNLRHVFQQMALAFVLVFVLLSLSLGIYQIFNRNLQDYSSDIVKDKVATVVVTVEKTAEIIREVATKVTVVEANEEETDVISALRPAGVIIEEMYEIAPPRNLRQMIEKESQGKNDSLSVYSPAPPNPDGKDDLVMDAEGNAYAVWTDNRDGQTTIYFVRSIDGGQTWDEKVQISSGSEKVFSPSLAVDTKHNFYVVWRSGYKANANIYFAYSINRGQTWSKSIRVDNETGRTYNPSLAVDTQGALYIAWQNRRSANINIYFTHSTDGGQTWSDKIRVANIGS